MNKRKLIAACVVVALVGCGGGGDPPSAPIAPVDAGTTLTSSIVSAQTGITYDLDVWLPPGYAQASLSYPVIYAMDCEYRFATLVPILQARIGQGGAPAILVNVCAMGAARRWIDFTMPGASAYYRFLTLELIPSIDKTYRTNRAGRILSGHSLSGEFALYALYLEDPAHRYFTSFISEECSCWYDASMVFSQQLALPLAMEQAMYNADQRLPVTLVMAGDELSNEAPVKAVYDVISSRHYLDLRIYQPTYRLGHVPMDGPAFNDALTLVFSGT